MEENGFENVLCEMSTILSLPQCVKLWVSSRDLTMIWLDSNLQKFTTDMNYCQTSNIRHALGNTVVDHSDVVGASPVGAAPTTSSFLTQHLASMDWAQTTTRRDEKHLSFGICCDLYQRFDSKQQLAAVNAFPMKYADCFIVLCYVMGTLSVLLDLCNTFNCDFRTDSLALGQSHNCFNKSRITLNDMGQINRYHIWLCWTDLG